MKMVKVFYTLVKMVNYIGKIGKKIREKTVCSKKWICRKEEVVLLRRFR